MTLTDEQLEAIKTKIETENVPPIRAIKELHPDEDAKALRDQLFGKYDKKKLRSFSKSATDDN